MTAPTALSATWQLRRVRDQLTSDLAELHHVAGFVEDEDAVDKIRDAAAKVTMAAARVEQARRVLCSPGS